MNSAFYKGFLAHQISWLESTIRPNITILTQDVKELPRSYYFDTGQEEIIACLAFAFYS
jgi:hypothetical protein